VIWGASDLGVQQDLLRLTHLRKTCNDLQVWDVRTKVYAQSHSNISHPNVPHYKRVYPPSTKAFGGRGRAEFGMYGGCGSCRYQTVVDRQFSPSAARSTDHFGTVLPVAAEACDSRDRKCAELGDRSYPVCCMSANMGNWALHTLPGVISAYCSHSSSVSNENPQTRYVTEGRTRVIGTMCVR
jgi:hypothetical protein